MGVAAELPYVLVERVQAHPPLLARLRIRVLKYSCGAVGGAESGWGYSPPPGVVPGGRLLAAGVGHRTMVAPTK